MISGARRAFPPIVHLALLALATVGCFKHTNVDPSKLSCHTENDCPSNWQCMYATPTLPGICCENGVCPADGGVDAVASEVRASDGAGLDGAGSDGAITNDSLRSDGAQDLVPGPDALVVDPDADFSTDTPARDTSTSSLDTLSVSSPDVPDTSVVDVYVSNLDGPGVPNPDAPIGLNPDAPIIVANPDTPIGLTPDAPLASDTYVPPPDTAVADTVPDPVITSFTASAPAVNIGQKVILTAQFSGGTAKIDPGIPVVTSNAPVESPEGLKNTTTFTLTVTNSVGVEKTKTVQVLAGIFTSTGPNGNLNTPRYSHLATKMKDGRVLITGGSDSDGNVLASAETYDPATKKFTPTSGDMKNKRQAYTATLLKTGKVLITGGYGATVSAELFDPAAGTNGQFTATQGSMTVARQDHTATLLSDGKVLIVGGLSPSGTLASLDSAELYDPVTDTFAATGKLSISRCSHGAVALNDGTVLVAGGSHLASGMLNPISSVNLYDPIQGLFSPKHDLAKSWASSAPDFTALLPSEKIIFLGASTMLLFDPAQDSSVETQTQVPYQEQRGMGSMTLLPGPGGLLLKAGGVFGTNGARPEAWLYDPVADTNTATSSLHEARSSHSATLLEDGSVLLVGGETGDPFNGGMTTLGSAEIFR